MQFKRNDENDIISKIYKSDKIRRYSIFIVGVLLQALAFNIFMSPNNLTFGVSGIAIIIQNIFGVIPSYTIFMINMILIIASLIYLGTKPTSRTIIGAILYPLFIELTKFVVPYVDLGTTEPAVLALAGATLCGFGTGLVLKVGYTTGGSDVLKQLVSKYGKKTLGQATTYVEGVIVTLGLLVFGWQTFIYSIISIIIVGIITDKVVIGISEYKTFQIITTKDKEVKKFILEQLGHGATIIESKGGFTEIHSKIILCTIPTKEYFLLKEGINQIDKNAFFIVTDTYEVNGGN